MNDLLDEFSTVTLVPVIYGTNKAYELRLYIPNRIEGHQMVAYLDSAKQVFFEANGRGTRFTVETNQSRRICLNGFVEPTERLRTAVNEIRKKRGLKPCPI